MPIPPPVIGARRVARTGRRWSAYRVSRGRGAANANGAGIAADPTLTSAWSSRPVPPEGGALVGKRLAPDVSPSTRQAGHPVPSPALAPASGSASVSHPVRGPAPRRFRKNRDRSILGDRPSDRFRTAAEAARKSCQWPTGMSGLASDRFRIPLKRCPCIRPKPSAGVPRGARGQIRYLIRV